MYNNFVVEQTAYYLARRTTPKTSASIVPAVDTAHGSAIYRS